MVVVHNATNIILSEEKPQNKARLKSYLFAVGSFPQAFRRVVGHCSQYTIRSNLFRIRPAIYNRILNCPSSPTFFTLLSTDEDAPLLAAFRSEWELEDLLAQSRMER